jgi:hypothetical protein
LNIREKLANNSQESKSLVTMVHLDVIAIQESLYATAVNVPGFFWIAPDRPTSGKKAASRSPLRGIGFLVCNQLRSLVKVCSVKRNTDGETFWLKVCGHGHLLETYLCCAYAPGSYHAATRCESFFSVLAEECIHFQARGDILILGDFNARIGQLSGDSDSNANGPRLLNFIRTAFGEPGNACSALLNCSGINHGLPTRSEGGSSSIIDYIVSSSSSQVRVLNTHVETMSQAKGANGCGSDHNLLWVDWQLHCGDGSLAPKSPDYRLCFDKAALFETDVANAYHGILTASLNEWKAAWDSFCVAQVELPALSPSDQQILIDGAYASWNFLIHDALCSSVPVKSVGRHSKDWWDPALQELICKRTAAHACNGWTS